MPPISSLDWKTPRDSHSFDAFSKPCSKTLRKQKNCSSPTNALILPLPSFFFPRKTNTGAHNARARGKINTHRQIALARVYKPMSKPRLALLARSSVYTKSHSARKNTASRRELVLYIFHADEIISRFIGIERAAHLDRRQRGAEYSSFRLYCAPRGEGVKCRAAARRLLPRGVFIEPPIRGLAS